ncbi:MAG: hypothetical protein ACQERP_12400, partial [Pseudomonadota bacterium]
PLESGSWRNTLIFLENTIRYFRFQVCLMNKPGLNVSWLFSLVRGAVMLQMLHVVCLENEEILNIAKTVVFLDFMNLGGLLV